MSPAEARLLRKLFRNSLFQTNGCFEWTGHRDKDGYGLVSIEGHTRRVPRVVLWLLADMELTSEAPVLHRCDNPPCWNPEHIYVGTHAENTQDAYRRGRIQARQGSNCSQSKIDEEQALAIKMRLRSGVPQVAIAAETGHTKQLINQIATGRTWAHVQLPHSPNATYCPECGVELFTAYNNKRRRSACVYCYRQEQLAA